MNRLDTMETEYHDFDQAEINAQQDQIDEDGWEEIKGFSKAKIIADKYLISESQVYQEIRNGNSEIITEYIKLIKASK